MLIRRREQEIRRTQPRVFAASATISTLDRRTFLRRSGLRRHARDDEHGSARLRAGCRGERLQGGRRGRGPEECLHALLRRLHRHRRGRKRRMDPPATRVGQPDQSRHPLRQGRRQVVHGGRRLKYPLKLEGGEGKRISWHQAAPAQGTTWPPAGPPLADVPQQKSGMAAPVPPPESAQKPPFVTVEQARAYLNANDLLACQEAARRMRGAGVLMPDGLIALAALRSDLLQAGQDSR